MINTQSFSRIASGRGKDVGLYNCFKLLILWPYGLVLLILCAMSLRSYEQTVWTMGIICLWFLMMSYGLRYEIRRSRRKRQKSGDKIRLYHVVKEAPMLPGQTSYSGARAPALANKSLIYPRNIFTYLFAVLLGGICLGCLCFVDAHSLYTRAINLICAWGAARICLLDWMLKIDHTHVTLHYSFRKRAIIVRSSDRWLAVIPYTELRAWHVGKKHGILETTGGVHIPCPATVPKEKLSSLSHIPYRSGRIRFFFIMFISHYLISMIGACILLASS